jgi:hypothetical protein
VIVLDFALTSQFHQKATLEPSRLDRSPERPLCQRELDLALPAADLLDTNADRIAEPEDPSPATTRERGAGVVQLEVIAQQPPHREVPLEHVPEADEEARRDHASDLSLERLLPPTLEQHALKKPGETDVVGGVLDLGDLALPAGDMLGQVTQVLRQRIIALPDLRQERPVADDVTETADGAPADVSTDLGRSPCVALPAKRDTGATLFTAACSPRRGALVRRRIP